MLRGTRGGEEKEREREKGRGEEEGTKKTVGKDREETGVKEEDEEEEEERDEDDEAANALNGAEPKGAEENEERRA